MTTVIKVKPAALSGLVVPERAIKGALSAATWRRLQPIWRMSNPTKEWCIRLYQYISEVMPCPSVSSITMLEYLLREGVEAYEMWSRDTESTDQQDGHRVFIMAVVDNLPALLDMNVYVEPTDAATRVLSEKGSAWDATLGSVLDWAKNHSAVELCVEHAPINAEFARPMRNGISLVLAGASHLLCRRDIVKFDYPSLGNQFIFYSKVEFSD